MDHRITIVWMSLDESIVRMSADESPLCGWARKSYHHVDGSGWVTSVCMSADESQLFGLTHMNHLCMNEFRLFIVLWMFLDKSQSCGCVWMSKLCGWVKTNHHCGCELGRAKLCELVRMSQHWMKKPTKLLSYIFPVVWMSVAESLARMSYICVDESEVISWVINHSKLPRLCWTEDIWGNN